MAAFVACIKYVKYKRMNIPTNEDTIAILITRWVLNILSIIEDSGDANAFYYTNLDCYSLASDIYWIMNNY